MEVNGITHEIIGAAIEVHRELGPGLLESIYEECLVVELRTRGVSLERQVTLPIRYKGMLLGCDYRLDLVVENKVIAEIKAVESLMPVHEAQLLTYLKLTHMPAGLLINFNTDVLRNGIKRMLLN